MDRTGAGAPLQPAAAPSLSKKQLAEIFAALNGQWQVRSDAESAADNPQLVSLRCSAFPSMVCTAPENSGETFFGRAAWRQDGCHICVSSSLGRLLRGVAAPGAEGFELRWETGQVWNPVEGQEPYRWTAADYWHFFKQWGWLDEVLDRQEQLISPVWVVLEYVAMIGFVFTVLLLAIITLGVPVFWLEQWSFHLPIRWHRDFAKSLAVLSLLMLHCWSRKTKPEAKTARELCFVGWVALLHMYTLIMLITTNQHDGSLDVVETSVFTPIVGLSYMSFLWSHVLRRRFQEIFSGPPSSRVPDEDVPPVEDWAHLRPVQGDLRETLIQDFKTASTATPGRTERLEVEEVYEVLSQFDGLSEATRCLYHGSSWTAGFKISQSGFRLPEHPGMFGRAVYFASSPMKSFRYCCTEKERASRSFDLTIPRCIIAAEVALGRCMDVQRPAPSATPDMLQALDGTTYDSIHGLVREEGGVLLREEFAVYDPARAVPKFIFSVRGYEE